MLYVRSKFTLWADQEFQTVVVGYRASTWYADLYPDGRLYIRRGYPWDGGTGAVDDRMMVRMSLPHDVCCEMVADGVLPMSAQPLIDEQFRLDGERRYRTENGRQVSMTWLRRMWTYLGVRGYQVNNRERERRQVLELEEV